MKLVKRPVKQEVDLSDTQMLAGFEIMELDLAKKEGWTCPNPGCNVHYAKKGKYIVSSWQVDGNSKVLDSCIICVLSSHFKKRENINLA